MYPLSLTHDRFRHQSDVAVHAQTLVDANGMSDRITILHGKIEEVEIPEKVDMIVSEPMGFLLVHERMLESYIVGRDRFMKPGGNMFPSIGTIYVCPFTDAALHAEQLSKVDFWKTPSFYGVDLSCLEGAAMHNHFAQPVCSYE